MQRGSLSPAKVFLLVAAALVALNLPGQGQAVPMISCDYDATDQEISIAIQGSDGRFYAPLLVDIGLGDSGAILINSVTCGDATTANTVSASLTATSESETIKLDQRNGAFAPPLTPEGDGVMEIAWSLGSGINSGDWLFFYAGPGGVSTSITPAGMNLNGDDDLDVFFDSAPRFGLRGSSDDDSFLSTVTNREIWMNGAGGADTLDAQVVDKPVELIDGYDQPYQITAGDTFRGGTSSTVFRVETGPDVIEANSSNDKLVYEGPANCNYKVDLAAHAAKKICDDGEFVWDDVLLGRFEKVSTSGGFDVLKGDRFANALDGGEEVDLLIGRGGDDRLDGGSRHPWERDRVSYATSPNPIDMSYWLDGGSCCLGKTNLSVSGWGNDKLFRIARVVGSSHGDRFSISSCVRRHPDVSVDGKGGGDSFLSDPGGHRLKGGGGSDTLKYIDGCWTWNTPTEGIHVNLGEGKASGWQSASSIENVRGASGRDRLIGSQKRNQLSGAEGNDYLRGARGRDRLDGGRGHDECWERTGSMILCEMRHKAN